MVRLGGRQHLLEERSGHLTRQQAVPVLHEDGHGPHRGTQIEADTPAEQQVVLQCLRQEPLTPEAVEHRQQLSLHEGPQDREVAIL